VRHDLTGRRYGRLTVVKYLYTDNNKKPHWLCICECGVNKDIAGSSLKNGLTNSCGCLRREVAAKRQTRHGMSQSVEYSTWIRMRDRCNNPNSRDYIHYGARGINVCQEWMDSFDRFFLDMGARPDDKHSLDRINNELGYGPNNCRWARQDIQVNNRGVTKRVSYMGEDRTLKEWSDITGVSYWTLRSRYDAGKSPEDILCELPSIK
jgi:hypothetical protein